MEIEIRPISLDNIQDINQVDGSFWADSRLVLSVKDSQISYTVEPMPGYTKRYDIEPLDYTAYIDALDKTIFLAHADGQIAGQIILKVNWNRFVYVEDIAVDAHYRRHGIGQSLMRKAVEWSRDKNLPGIMLETQDINVTACHFYQHFGFVLAGFDYLLYKATLPESAEIALYWYLIFV